MSDFTPSRGGQVNNTGDAKALFLKKWSGEVIAAFRERNRFMERHMVRTITDGKSVQFPVFGKATSSYHTPGAEIDGQQIAGNERVITIDDLLISPVFIPLIDEAMAHYDYRREYSFQCGAALSRAFDKNVAQVGVLAARASATVTGGNGGSVITEANAKTDADALIEAAFAAAQALDEKDVPPEDRTIFLRPAEYYLLVNSGSKLVQADFVEGTNGGMNTGRVLQVAGLDIVMTNNLPNTDVDSGPSDYQGNFTTTAGLVMHRSAVGTVKLLDLSTDVEYSARHQGTFVVSKYAVGHGILRPEAAVEIRTGAPAD